MGKLNPLEQTTTYLKVKLLSCFLLMSFLSMSGNPLFATLETEIDSLNALIHEEQADTTRLIALNELAYRYFRTNTDTVLPICERIVKEANDLLLSATPAEAKVYSQQKSSAQSNIGYVYYQRGQFPQAIESWKEALEGHKKAGNQSGMAIVYNNIGNAYSDVENEELARYCWAKSLESYQALKDTVGIARIYNNFGYVSRLNGEHEKAKEWYSRALQLRRESGDEVGVAIGYNNIGYIHKKESRFDSAITYFQSSAEIWRRQAAGQELAAVYVNLAEVHIRVENYPKSLYFLEQADSLEKDNGWLSLRMDIAKFYAEYYEATGDAQLALDEYRNYVTFRDSLFDVRKQKEVIEQQLQYEFLRKEKARETSRQQERALQEEKSKRQWVILALVGVALLMVLFFAGVLFKRIRLINAQKGIIEDQSRQLEMVALRTQMNPHFIFNSLNSIKHYVIRNDTKQAVAYLNKFARLIRLILENSKENLIPLDEELVALEHYMTLERIRFDGKFEFSIDNQLENRNIEAPPLVLQPYVENAIWHGIMPLSGTGKIRVSVKQEADQIHIEIEDNGIGREAARKLKSKGDTHKQSMGLTLSRDRLRLLDLVRGQATQVEIEDLYHANGTAKGTLVRIQIVKPHE